MAELPKPGSLWIDGDHEADRPVRVMAVVEGWVVARKHGAAPFLVHKGDWHKRFLPTVRAAA